MVAYLNKKILCFLDEYGTAGAGSLYLGAVIVLARDAGRMDKCFSDLLEANANEIHAVNLDDKYLQGLLQRFWMAAPRDRVVRLDSAASRLLQLADVVAYARKWIVAEDLNALGLRERFGIHLP